MGSSTGLYGGFIIDSTELISSLGQFEKFGPLAEKNTIKKRFCSDTGDELDPETIIDHPPFPSTGRGHLDGA